MKYFIVLTLPVLTLLSCSRYKGRSHNNADSKPSQSFNSKDILHQFDSTAVTKWLTNVIIHYAQNTDTKDGYNEFTSNLTDEYSNYKHEEMGIGYGYSDMTIEEFNKKWSYKYNTMYAGSRNFFGLAQDHGEVKIPKCKLIKTLGDSIVVYNVIVRDVTWDIDVIQDIKIVKRGNKLLIDDVIEYK